MISGLGTDGRSYVYTNVLQRFNPDVPLQASDAAERWYHFIGYCCPPNLSRTVVEMRAYFYSSSAGRLWVHMYAANDLNTRLPDGTRVAFREETNYPWDGRVAFTMELEEPAEFALMLRIPEWEQGAAVTINGRKSDADVAAGKYVDIRRTWRKGDRVQLDLPLRTRLIASNPLVEQNRNLIAVARGPVVYCSESVDLPKDVKPTEVIIPRMARFEPVYEPKLLGAVGVLRVNGLRMPTPSPEWSERPYGARELYAPVPDRDPTPLQVTLIPYFAGSNRGVSEMAIWLPIGW